MDIQEEITLLPEDENLPPEQKEKVLKHLKGEVAENRRVAVESSWLIEELRSVAKADKPDLLKEIMREHFNRMKK